MTKRDPHFRLVEGGDTEIYKPVCALLDDIASKVGCDEAHVLLVNDDSSTLELEVVIQKSGAEKARVRGRESTILRYRGLRGITGLAAKTKCIQNVPNVLVCEDYLEHFTKTRSELAVPLVLNGKCIAVVNLESEQPGYFSSQVVKDLDILRASSLVIDKIFALREHWKVQCIDQDLALLTALVPWCSKMLRAHDRGDLCRMLADACLDLLPAVDIVEIALADPPKIRMHNLYRASRPNIDVPDVGLEGEHFLCDNMFSQTVQQISEFDLNRPQELAGLLRQDLLDSYDIRYGFRVLLPPEERAFSPGAVTFYSARDLYTLHEANEKVMGQLSEFAARAFDVLNNKTVLDVQQKANRFLSEATLVCQHITPCVGIGCEDDGWIGRLDFLATRRETGS